MSFFVIVVYFSFNTHKVEIVIKKYIHMHLNILDLKIKIFCDLQVFVLSSIPKYENSGIAEMLQKRYNTEIRKCTFKNSSNALQITSTSKWFSHISNQVAGICLLRASNPTRFIELSSLLFISVLLKIWIKKQTHLFELYRSKK